MQRICCSTCVFSRNALLYSVYNYICRCASREEREKGDWHSSSTCVCVPIARGRLSIKRREGEREAIEANPLPLWMCIRVEEGRWLPRSGLHRRRRRWRWRLTCYYSPYIAFAATDWQFVREGLLFVTASTGGSIAFRGNKNGGAGRWNNGLPGRLSDNECTRSVGWFAVFVHTACCCDCGSLSFSFSPVLSPSSPSLSLHSSFLPSPSSLPTHECFIWPRPSLRHAHTHRERETHTRG